MPDLELTGKVALIIAGKSNAATQLARDFSTRGADIALIYRDASPHAEEARQAVESLGKRCLLLYGDAYQPDFSAQAKEQVIRQLGRLDMLVTEAGRVLVLPA